MLIMLTSNIMPRTTLDLDPSVLNELRRRSTRERKSMGTVASELLTVTLAEIEDVRNAAPALKWVSRDLGAPRVDLEDKEALHRALDMGP
jgi:hypothetical protein